MNIIDLQKALYSAGFDPGPLDGVAGRKTIAAVKAFQRAYGLTIDGIVGPETLGVLLSKKPGTVLAPIPGVEVPWLQELLRRKGLHETRDKSALVAWLRSDGKTLGDPSKLPWCGDAIQTCLALTLPDEPFPSNPYLARNWLKFGVRLDEPSLGAIGVAYRGDRNGSSGHVFLYNGEVGDHIRAAGGNQRDAITTDALIRKDRILGWRWPLTVPLPKTGRVILKTGGGHISTNEA